MSAELPWQLRAACRDEDPDLFWPTDSDLPGQAAAIRICARCPVRPECGALADAHRETDGIWGGSTRNQRGGATRLPGRRPKDAPDVPRLAVDVVR